MAKVGRFVVDPKAGAYCHITLDSGEKIIVNHDKGRTKGGSLTIEKTGWLGLGGERVFAGNLARTPWRSSSGCSSASPP